jgi:1,4-dihydroxy-2-naphthoate octaprenyltransferase
MVLFMDLSTHFNNDYYDVDVDRSAPFKPFGSVNQFIENPNLMDSGLLVSAACSFISLFIASTHVIIGTSWQLLGFVVLFNVLGWLYSAPPVRLHSHRLGEVTIAVGTGLCVPAVGYLVSQGIVDQLFTLFSVPLVLYGFVLSLSLQIPDYEVDKSMGKNTIVGLIGRKWTYLLVLLSCLMASGIYFVYISFLSEAVWLSMVPLVSSVGCLLALSDSPKHARLFTKINISALFLFLFGLNLILLLEAGLF